MERQPQRCVSDHPYAVRPHCKQKSTFFSLKFTLNAGRWAEGLQKQPRSGRSRRQPWELSAPRHCSDVSRKNAAAATPQPLARTHASRKKKNSHDRGGGCRGRRGGGGEAGQGWRFLFPRVSPCFKRQHFCGQHPEHLCGRGAGGEGCSRLVFRARTRRGGIDPPPLPEHPPRDYAPDRAAAPAADGGTTAQGQLPSGKAAESGQRRAETEGSQRGAGEPIATLPSRFPAPLPSLLPSLPFSSQLEANPPRIPPSPGLAQCSQQVLCTGRGRALLEGTVPNPTGRLQSFPGAWGDPSVTALGGPISLCSSAPRPSPNGTVPAGASTAARGPWDSSLHPSPGCRRYFGAARPALASRLDAARSPSGRAVPIKLFRCGAPASSPLFAEVSLSGGGGRFFTPPPQGPTLSTRWGKNIKNLPEIKTLTFRFGSPRSPAQPWASDTSAPWISRRA
ncbi:uncharacterized protein LOC142364947 [Opisthocomus hoazin]|uniref:uncharacterized protein LOC142364947 n=1 Tax=Opisthocomus hoazin TaxID=30419 RepID=UPI003F5395B6